MTQLYFVQTYRQRMDMPRKRIADLVGPFDTWTSANDYAHAWRGLWKAQRGVARVEVPISPCDAVTEWHNAKLERDAAAPLPPWDGGGARTGNAMRRAIVATLQGRAP
jgi:hypothetical protein